MGRARRRLDRGERLFPVRNQKKTRARLVHRIDLVVAFAEKPFVVTQKSKLISGCRIA